MKKLLFCAILLTTFIVRADSPTNSPAGTATLIIVVGAAGEEEFGKHFEQWAGNWEKSGRTAGAKQITIGLKPATDGSDRESLKQTLAAEAKEGSSELWLVLLGHGTFDGQAAKFNLRGEDLTATEFATWLQPFRRPVAVINSASASGAFLKPLSAAGRVVITGTRSGSEQNYARFGQFLAEAVADPQADLDKDGQTSLLEAFLTASRRVTEFYKTEGRLATEHALLDDNGDGLGTPADWFRGIRAVKRAQAGAALDGLRAHQFHLVRSATELKLAAPVRARRDELEVAIAKLSDAKKDLAATEYYRRLEVLLLELARLYEQKNPAP